MTLKSWLLGGAALLAVRCDRRSGSPTDRQGLRIAVEIAANRHETFWGESMNRLLSAAVIGAGLLAAAPAFAAEYATVKLETTVNAPVDAVWAKVGGYCAIQEWIKRLAPCVLVGDGGVGSIRKLGPQGFIEVMVAAFKNKNLSKDDLLHEATGALEALGNGQIAVGNVNEISSDYSLAEMTMVDSNSVRYKTLVLVATDVTDNYIMIIGTPENQFAQNRDTLDAMWSSFEMWSGGASGDS